jgi:hypothetical protein
MDDGPIVAAAKVTDIGAQQFIDARAGQQSREDKGAVALDPVGASRGCGSVLRFARSAATEPAGKASAASSRAWAGRPTASGWPQSAPTCTGM